MILRTIIKVANDITSGGSRISPRRGRQHSGGGGAPRYDFIKIS